MKLICKDTNKGSITFLLRVNTLLGALTGMILLMMCLILYWMVIIIMRVYSFIPRPPACARSIGVTGIKSNFLS